MKQIRTLAVIALLLGTALAQNRVRDQNTLVFTVTGVTQIMRDGIGTQYNQWELLVTGAPATMTVTVTGCMRGGTCSATLATSSGTANQILNTTGVYDYYNVAAAWTGGTAPTVTVNRTATIAMNGGNLGLGITNDGTTLTFTGNGGIVAKSFTANGTATQLTCPEMPAPATPTSGVMYIYCSSVDHQVHTLNSNGIDWGLPGSYMLTNVNGGSTVVGTGALATVYTYAIPAFAMKAGTGIQVDAWFRCSPCVGGAITWQWNYGATSIASLSDAATTTTISHAGLRVFNNSGVTNAQTMVAENIFHGTAPVSPGAPATPAENTASGTVTLSLQFNSPATASIIPVMFTVQAIRN